MRCLCGILHECTDGTYRQPDNFNGAAVCENSFWFGWLRRRSRGKLEGKKEVKCRHTTASREKFAWELAKADAEKVAVLLRG
jgi:hypothetical protein